MKRIPYCIIMIETNFASSSTSTSEGTKGGRIPDYRLFVARAFEPQTLPIAFTASIIIVWSIAILIVAIVFHAYFMSVTR